MKFSQPDRSSKRNGYLHHRHRNWRSTSHETAGSHITVNPRVSLVREFGAAAFVGGVAAAMLSCNGGAYIDKQMIDAGRIKSRLLSTARPITLDPRRKGKSVGVVNPRAAILSPDKTWLRSDRHVIARRIIADSEPYQAYEEAKWCLERIEYKLIGQPGELKSLTTANIVSMRRSPTADSTS